MQDGSRRARLRALLVVALLAFAAAPSAASAADYVALGDSYASGTGTRAYYEGCERSVHAYPYLIKGSLGTSFTFIACGGARTQDVLDNQVSRLDAGTKFATISIGGNDAGFSSVITECAKPAIPFVTNPCFGRVTNAQNYINNTLPGRLDTVYTAMRNRSPNAVIAVVGYPRLFNGEDCNAGTFFSGDELNRLNQTADQLASVTRARAQAHGFTFVDARAAFDNHAVCDDDEWLNGLSNPVGESYHPNRNGHSQGYAGIVRTALLAAPVPGAPVGGVGRIAFTTNRDGNAEVYASNADGGFPTNLTNHPSADVDPAWSPDGTKLAFASNRDGDNEIYVVNADGSGLVQLTSNASDDRDPAWAPNGQQIAFRSDRTGNNEIFRMWANGASQTNVTNNGASDWAPDWSPDGAEIAFQRFTAGGSTGQGNEIFKANADGQGQLNLTNNASSVHDGRPAWSPSGTSIAFHSNRDGDFEIFTMSATGGTATQRTANGALDQKPAWSPTGAQIAFQSTRDGNDEIYTMTATGGSQTNRTLLAASDTFATWQADSAPPRTTISSGPDGPTDEARPTFAFASSEPGSALQCRVDGAAFKACTSPYRTDALAEGEHTFQARSVDPAGNSEAQPATRTFLVDLTPPEVTVTCPETLLRGAEAVATVEATDELSGIAPDSDPSGEHALDTTVAGPVTFTIEATDRAGNTTEAECEYVVRHPAPGAPALASGESPNAGDFALAWSPSAPPEDGLTYTLERRDADDEAWSEVAAGLTAPAHAFASSDDEGTWRYRAKAVDPVASLESDWSEESSEVVVDRSAPAAPSVQADRAPEFAGDGGWFRDAVTVTTADAGDPALGDGSAGSGVDPASVAGPETLTATTNVLRTVRDRVGHVSRETARAFQVDADAPELRLTCPDSVLLNGTATVRVAASDAGSGLAADPTATIEVDTRRAGLQTFTRTATDNVGHGRTEACSVRVRYAFSGLEPPFKDGAGSAKAGSTVPLKFTLADAHGVEQRGVAIRVQLERLASSEEGAPVEEVVEGTSTNGKGFDAGPRYDFNLSTKGLQPGAWRVRLTFDDGTVHRVPLTLR